MTPACTLDTTLATTPLQEALDACLDTDRMRRTLSAHLPECLEGRCDVLALRVAKVRRNTSIKRNPHPMTVLYEVDLMLHATQSIMTERFHAKVYRDGRSALEGFGDGGDAAASLHLPAHDMRLWRWPADPGLPQLPTLLDPGHIARWWGPPAAAVVLLRYEPESRATLRYARPAGVEGDETMATLYAKTFADTRGEAIHRRFEHFWQRAEADRQAFTVARPLGYDPDTRSVWQASALGRTLVGWLGDAHRAGDTSTLDDTAAHLAEAMAALHTAPVSLAGPLVRDMPHWITELGRRSRKIARVAPALADRVAAVADALSHLSAGFTAAPCGLIHGDFHPEQVWALPRADAPGRLERLVLFDFDEFSLGDSMEDLAEFVTRLSEVEGGTDFGRRLSRAVASRSPTLHDERRLHWHLAVQQLLQACRAFAFQRPGWRDAIEPRLAGAEAFAKRAQA